jgi:glucokinase
MRPLAESMPLQVIVNENTGLWGAARCAEVRARSI